MQGNPEDDGGRIQDLTRRIRTGARRVFTGGAEPAAQLAEPSGPAVTRRLLPVRYYLRESDGERYLSCGEASNISVRVERGLSVSASSARKAPRGTIYLDGAAQGEPFVDAGKSVLNLDHHEGCVRAFTLATCEQAMVLLLKGLDLDDEQWTVWLNDPDLDAVLAVWLLLNHRRVTAEDGSLRDRIMPVVRLQGVIDAHGFELASLSAFPEALQQRALDTINRLRAAELALKEEGSWSSTDLLEYTRAALQGIDEEFYSPGDFANHSNLEELGRVRITPQRLAIACRADGGIYEVEEQLREIHGDKLGLIILQKDARTYTLRQSDPFLPQSLEAVYERLNLVDQAAHGESRWGGSADIGGSPRGGGTALGLEDIVAACRWVFQPPSWWRRLGVVAGASAMVAMTLVAAAVVAGLPSGLRVPGLLVTAAGRPEALPTALLTLVALALTLWRHHRTPGLVGLRPPRRFGFLLLTLPAAAAVAAGGGWAAPGAVSWAGLGLMAVGVLGIELLIHGAAQGLMATAFPVMAPSGRRFVSLPNGLASVLYAAAVACCLAPPLWLAGAVGTATSTVVWLVAAAVLAILCGAARERWGSVWAAVLLHAAAVLVVLGAVTALS